MKKTIYFNHGSLEKGYYSGFLIGICSKSGRAVLHRKRRLHLIHPFTNRFIGNSVCHTIFK